MLPSTMTTHPFLDLLQTPTYLPNTYTYIYIHIYILSLQYIYIYVYTYTCIYICTYIYIYMYIHTHIYTYIYIHTYIYTYICIHICIHTYTYAITNCAKSLLDMCSSAFKCQNMCYPHTWYNKGPHRVKIKICVCRNLEKNWTSHVKLSCRVFTMCLFGKENVCSCVCKCLYTCGREGGGGVLGGGDALLGVVEG